MTLTPTNELCPYCGESKPSSEFSIEHVLPRALGGALEPTNPFTIRTCRRCNNACGKYVDGRFVRSWMIYNWRAESQRRTYDPERSILSLLWIGPLQGWQGSDGTVVDMWLGPAGDQVYHFHEPYPDDEASVFAGRPPHLPSTRTDSGSVYILARTGTDDWIKVLLRSVKGTFDREAAFHFLNGAPPGRQPPHPAVPPERQSHVAWIRSRKTTEPLQARLVVDMDWGARFLVKFTLGLAAAVLAPTFPSSAYSQTLRSALWARDFAGRQNIQLRGRGFFQSDPVFTKALGWLDCHTVAVIPVDAERVMAVLTLFGKHQATLVASEEAKHWKSRIDDHGTIWVIAPGFGKFEGPMSLPEYFEATIDDVSPNRLSRLRRILEGGTPLPTFETV